MKIRCDRINLIESLNSIAGIIPVNSTKPILSNFLLVTQEQGLLAEASDLELSGLALIHRVEVVRSGEVALPSARLLSIIKEIPDDAITITSRDESEGGHGAIIESGGFRFNILGNDPAEFPRAREPETSANASLRRDKFSDGLRRVAVAASRDPTRYQLNGVYLQFDKDRLYMTATDGKRLTHDHFRVEREGEEPLSAIVPNQAVDAFLRVLGSQGVRDELVRLSLSDTHIALKTEDHQVFSNLIEGVFPNYQSIFPPEPRIRAKVKRSAFISAARSAALTTDKISATVNFHVGLESIVIQSNAQDIGETRIEIPVESSGLDKEPSGALDIRFNPVFLLDALRTFEEEDIQIEFQDARRPAILRGSHHYRHMVMPLVDK